MCFARIVGFFPKYGLATFKKAKTWAKHDIEYAIAARQPHVGLCHGGVCGCDDGVASEGKCVEAFGRRDYG